MASKVHDCSPKITIDNESMMIEYRDGCIVDDL